MSRHNVCILGCDQKIGLLMASDSKFTCLLPLNDSLLPLQITPKLFNANIELFLRTLFHSFKHAMVMPKVA